ncbi:MAG TPA: hypothetical protein H9746_00865 [Candidatus Butyricicoccus avistercoris]|uniref:Uncharacterized protein n=1 Tax=Candidatus Butyricicoccus avistercoris TaxID=2838518 RepID=A0A9D1TGY9_9FIRM|nr:hypothetical protein [Candidatus Butyricicoccus avistercoris]
MLTFDEFARLPMKEKAERYVELSDKDKFRARITEFDAENSCEVVKVSTKKEDIEAHEKFMRELKQAIKEGKVNLLQRNKD